MKSTIYLLAVAALCVAQSQGRHLHPRLGEFGEISRIENGLAAPDLSKAKVNWFVPVNSRLFFRVESPCEPGYKRDPSGVCREVWD